MALVKLKRVYEPPGAGDGYRVLVDRLWPRGISKEKGRVDLWLKDVAPSDDLRKWFSHDPEKWEEFQRRYRAELKSKPEPLQTLKKLAKEKKVLTLIYAASDPTHNNAVALTGMLK